MWKVPINLKIMCDSLGLSDKKITVYKLEALGSRVCYGSIEDLIEAIGHLAEATQVGEKEDIIIEVDEMYEHEFESLTEFEGF